MTSRERFLADCAQVWDESDDRAVFVFGEPGSQVGLFAGPMTTHMVGAWFCLHVGHADREALSQLVEQLRSNEAAHAPH